MIRFVIYGVNIHMYDILVILVDFCGNFPLFWLIFCNPDPADQNETNPDPQLSETFFPPLFFFHYKNRKIYTHSL